MTRNSFFTIPAKNNSGKINQQLSIKYLLCDCTGTIDELSFGEAVRGGDLQSSGLLDQKDTPMSELLHSSLDLKPNLNKTEDDAH